jgi:AhpD family alkylhydroperoxidase
MAYKEKLEDIERLMERLKAETPEPIQAFKAFMAAVERPSPLNLREKELINVALAVAPQCEWCIAFHVKGALENGATRAEILDAAMQAVLMHGGPALMYLTPVLGVLDELGA